MRNLNEGALDRERGALMGAVETGDRSKTDRPELKMNLP
jgi:hypothetical protein